MEHQLPHRHALPLALQECLRACPVEFMYLQTA